MTLWGTVIHPITSFFRRKRGKLLISLFPNVRTLKICDLGGSRHFWEKICLEVPPSNITIFNISESETGAVSDDQYNGIKVIIYDGVRVPAKDKEFDLVVCNSVLEHVPANQRQALVDEMTRVAKHGFIQTPNYYFPFEPHFLLPFIHWCPAKIGWQLVQISPWKLLSKPDTETTSSYFWRTKLLTGDEIKRLFYEKKVRYMDERFAGLKKSLYVVW